MEFSPIALFVYNRPGHAKRMVESLLRNPEHACSQITVFCDGPKNDKDSEAVMETRQVIQKILPEAQIVEQENNLGLANSIIMGVSELCNQYGRVIVFEDDLILSPVVLCYLNKALDYYEPHKKVMHISAYMYPVEGELPPSFFYREATCWGWATWYRAWKNFQHDSDVISSYIKQYLLYKEFNINNSMFFWKMLQEQRLGKIDSWAIRWYGSMFMNKGLALHPNKPLVQNGGFDGTGIHCKETDIYNVLLSEEVPEFTNGITESNAAVNAMIKYRNNAHRKTLRNRISYLFGKIHALYDA